MNNFTPMLAHPTKSNKVDFNNKKYFVQPKLDGIRCYITKDGMFTRNHKPIVSAPHIFAELAYVFETFPNTILDGELYNHQLKNDFEKIVSLVRKTKPTESDLNESLEMVQFHCYDLFDGEYKDMTFDLRNREIATLIQDTDYTFTVATYATNNEEMIDKLYDLCMKQGYEGAMLREDAAYEQKRSWTLQKIKEFKDEEATIIGVVEGKGKLEGKVGKFLMVDSIGNEFGCPMSGNTFIQRAEAWENKESYIGQVATYVYFEKTKRGMPRFPVFKSLRNYE